MTSNPDRIADLAFDHAPLGLAVLDHRIIRRCNRQFAATFGAEAADLLNRPIADFYPSTEDYNRIGEVLKLSEAPDGLYNDERIMRRLDGQLFWCRVRGRSLTPDDPFKTGVWTFADLSSERPVVSLSAREREVAILTARGLSAKEIGRQLDLSYRTVETHRARLLEKFEARKLPELVAKLSGMPL